MIDSKLIAELASALPPDTAIILLLPGAEGYPEDAEDQVINERIFTGGMSSGGSSGTVSDPGALLLE